MMRKLLILALLVSGCPQGPQPGPVASEGGDTAPVTNRIDIPPKVIENLGIEFARVERRHVEQTLRYPGVFESPPEAARAYAASLPGRVEIHVRQYQSVSAGDLLARVEAPAWRETQRTLTALDSARQLATAAVATARADLAQLDAEREAHDKRIALVRPLIEASHAHQSNLQLELAHWQARVAELEQIAESTGGQATALAEARGQVAAARSALSEQEQSQLALQREHAEARDAAIPLARRRDATESRAREAETSLRAADRALEAELAVAASLLGVPASGLATRWNEFTHIEIKAAAPGIVTRLPVSTGAWAEAGATLVETLDASMLRFRAQALQSDLRRLKDGLPARVVAGAQTGMATAEGTLIIAPTADAGARTLELLLAPREAPEWARPGVTGQLEVVWDVTARAELAVPAAAVLRDGLEHVLFVRDPADANKVIRSTPQLGPSDGRWRVVYSDVIAGDEVVVAGAYELKLTGTGQGMKGGHFHADGTWHADGH